MSLFVSSFIDLNEYEERLSTKSLQEYIKNAVRLLTLTEDVKYLLFVTENIQEKLKDRTDIEEEKKNTKIYMKMHQEKKELSKIVGTVIHSKNNH